MVDISKHSTFPPLLGSYNNRIPSKIEYTPLSRCSDQMKSLLEHHKTKIEQQQKRHLPSPRKVPTPKKSYPRKTSLEILNKRLEDEAKQKEREKAENTLRAWDSLIRQKKDQRHRLLQQRVKIQRELIEKNNEFTNDLRAKAELERQEKARLLRDSKREFAKELKAHYQRVEEHKRRISKKMQEMQILEENTIELESTGTDPQVLNKVEDQVSGRELREEVSPGSGQEAMLQLLGVENTKSIHTMWNGMKMDSLRRITPMVKYSHQLKQVASPSIKQCLEVYEKPTARDRFTGKPIPLSDIIEEANLTKGYQLSAMNNTLELLARNAQKKAEVMLENKSMITSSVSCDPRSYLTDSQDPLSQHRPRLSTTTSKEAQPLIHKRYSTSPQMKKQLPSYLTSDGDLVSGSLEEFGDQFYCAPSRAKRIEDSVFLTDLTVGGSGQNSASSSAVELSNAGSRSSLKSVDLWQPLSTSALTEHSTVKEVAVSGLGHLGHGRYSMWRPATCVVESSDSSHLDHDKL